MSGNLDREPAIWGSDTLNYTGGRGELLFFCEVEVGNLEAVRPFGPTTPQKIAPMISDENLRQLREMMAALLEEYGFKKPAERSRTLAAERQRRFRERNAKGNAKVTRQGRKRNAKGNGAVTPITFDWETYAFRNITPEDMRRWQEAHPAIAIPDQIERAAIWLKANPKNRKSNYERFLANWFTRNQDRARTH